MTYGYIFRFFLQKIPSEIVQPVVNVCSFTLFHAKLSKNSLINSPVDKTQLSTDSSVGKTTHSEFQGWWIKSVVDKDPF